MSETTVCGHVRTAKVIFNRAAERDLIPFSPFDRLKGNAPMPDIHKRHYVSREDLKKILEACPDASWRALFALCRLAGLRRGEAIAMPWSAVDWNAKRLNVKDEKRGKIRIPPIDPPKLPCDPSLNTILLEAFEEAEPGEDRLWRRSVRSRGNLYRDAQVIIERAGLKSWAKTFQALRASCDTDMKQVYPEYVVDLCIGHSQKVSREHYLHIPEDVYRANSKQPESVK